MLNFFPELLNYSFLAPTILRIALAIVLVFSSTENLRNLGVKNVHYYLNLISILAGILLFVGIYTQIVAMAAIILALLGRASWQGKVLIITIALSLLLTGAGLFALDWPL